MATTTLPVRNLGSIGVVTDINPYNLPIAGFTAANNVRFDEGKIKRSVVFRTVQDDIQAANSGILTEPRGAMGIVPASGFDSVIVVSANFDILEYTNASLSNVRGAVTVMPSINNPFTMCVLADVSYINRVDKVPVHRAPNATTFSDLPNWNTQWRCAALRPFGDFLIAMNMTEGANNYPNRVRFSDIVQANQIPATWDEADVTASAGFNDLVQMQTAIVDGAELGTNFIFYSETEVMLMEFTGGTFIFNFRKLFSDDGVINQNCIVEADGKHFVFGNTDIYVHDGNTKQSIADEKVRQRIYSTLNIKNADRCFTMQNKELSEIYFCYQSGDALVSFDNVDRCNRAAVFNYKNNTWSFMDLPNVSAGTTANIDTVTTYAQAQGTYATIGGSYFEQGDSFGRHTIMVGDRSTAHNLPYEKMYALDLPDEGSSIAFAIDENATKPPIFERIGLDLDEMKQSIDGYKVITRILPQLSTLNTDNTTFNFQFGASDIPNQTPTYGSVVSFDTATDYKIDSRAAGRYLSYKVTLAADDYKDFSFSGFDIDVTTTGSK